MTDDYTEYKVKVSLNDRKQTYVGSIYHADLTQVQAVKVACCLNAMFAERGMNMYAEEEEVEA